MKAKTALRTLLGLLAVALAACGGGGQPQPDLSLAGISPQNPTVVQGQSVELTLTFASQSGFQGEVSLSVTDRQTGQAPSWLTFDPTRANLNVPRGDQVQVRLQVQVAANAPTRSHALRLKATYGNRTAEGDFTLTVTPPPDFTIALNPTSLTVQQGSNGTTTLTLTPQNGFTGTVNLALVDGNGNPVSGITLSPTSVNVTGTDPVTQTLTVNVAGSVPTGTYNLQVRATSGSLTKTANLTVRVSVAYTDAFVYQVSENGGVLVGSATVGNGIKPVVWRIDPASLSPGFHWLGEIAHQVVVLDTGVPSMPYGRVHGVTADGQVGCGYGSVRADGFTGDRALAWDLTSNQAIPLPGHSSGGNVAYACAKRGNDVYVVGRVIPNVPTPTIWKNYAIWHQNTSISYGIFHDITPDASRASAQLVYQGWVYDLNFSDPGAGQYTQLISSIGGAYWSRISPDGQAVAFSDSNSTAAAIKVWYGGNVYTVTNMAAYAVRVREGVAYVFGGANGVPYRWRSDTQVKENLNNVFADLLPSGVVLKLAGPVSLDHRVMVFLAFNPASGRDEIGLLIGEDPFRAGP